MKISEKLKKISIIALITCLLSTLSLIYGSTEVVNAAESPVKMYSANFYASEGGGATCYGGNIYVKVSNNGIYNSDNTSKKVTVRAKTYTTGWTNYSCQYVGNLDGGYQLWKLENLNSSFSCDYQYAIEYEVNGQAYWDNNNTNNYTQNNVMGEAVVKAHQYNNENNDDGLYWSDIYASVKNLGSNKVVRVRYTEDNGATWKDKDLSPLKTNQDGSEEWGVNIYSSVMYDTSKFHYAVYYQVNGNTYWDNNCYQNYTYSY